MFFTHLEEQHSELSVFQLLLDEESPCYCCYQHSNQRSSVRGDVVSNVGVVDCEVRQGLINELESNIFSERNLFEKFYLNGW